MSITLSYSTMSLFNSCERKFQHRKILRTYTERDKTPALAHGIAVDNGYGVYLATGDADLAILEAWGSFDTTQETEYHNPSMSCLAVQALIDLTPKTWKAFILPSGRPATQIAFKIKYKDYEYIGFVDGIVVDTITNKVIPLEVKTTSSRTEPRLLYLNSEQALIYAFIVMAANNMDTTGSIDYTYMVAQMFKTKSDLPKAFRVNYQKQQSDILHWLITLRLDIERIDHLRDLGFFPRRDKCMDWNRLCEFHSVCNLTDIDVTKPNSSTAHEIEFDFEFELDDLIGRVV